MEIFEEHFSKINENLWYDPENGNYEMFGGKGEQKHINYLTFRELFKEMGGRRDLNILETGMASAAGTRSTLLFDKYIRKYGGKVWSVDYHQYPVNFNRDKVCSNTKLYHADSVDFITNFEKYTGEKDIKFDVIYLDSYDLDFYNPIPSGTHGLKEYKAVLPYIKSGTLLLIDDTPISPYCLDTRGDVYEKMIKFYERNLFMPGKGMFVLNEEKNADTLLHQYQVLYKFK